MHQRQLMRSIEDLGGAGERQALGTRRDEWVPTVCYGCYNSCGIKVRRLNGRIVDIQGDPHNPGSRGRICAKGKARVMDLYDPNRVTRPLRRTNPHKGIGQDPQWEEISWEEALETVVARLQQVRDDDPRKLAIAHFDLVAHTFVSVWASAFGTPNLTWCAAGYYCGNASHPANLLINGAFNAEIDFERCEYVILVGAQMGFMVDSNANSTTQQAADARKRGMKLVVVDPVCTPAGAKADEWIPTRPGTDGAFALGMLNVLLNDLEIYDEEFLKRHTNAPYLIDSTGQYVRAESSGRPMVWDPVAQRARPFDEAEAEVALLGTYVVNGGQCWPAFQLLKDHVKQYTPEAVSEITTIPATTLRRLAREFGHAAKIGSQVVVEGRSLPYRPVAVMFKRGAGAHKHGMLTCLALHLLNVVVGAIDVPGGYLGVNPVGPFWEPGVSEDGLLIASPHIVRWGAPYPASEAEPPQTLDLKGLFPVALFTRACFHLSIADPQYFRLPYEPSALIHCRTNLMMSTVNPDQVAEALQKIPFMVSFARQIDETVEFADIVLPDAHDFERDDFFPANHPYAFLIPGPGDWYWALRREVVPPAGEARPWAAVLLEIAHRLGFADEVYAIANVSLNLKEPYMLDQSRRYSPGEIVDRQVKSLFGSAYKEEMFRKTSSAVSRRKKLEEAYPRPFLDARIPIYFEHLRHAGEDVERVTRQLGIAWDVSDYAPLPDWKPCPAYEEPPDSEYDLFAVNFKLPFHTFTITTENPWLDDLSERHPYAYKILINAARAQEKGIQDGDLICVESRVGKVQGRAKVVQGIHPEVVGIPGTFGHWAAGKPISRGKGVHFNALLPLDLERIDKLCGAVDACVRVRVYKA